jgi:putative endonuclease
MSYFVYILTNKYNNVLYTGVTRDLLARVGQHRSQSGNGFTNRYKVQKLVYFEVFDDPVNAIAREKQIKGGSRQDKINLIIRLNPQWEDLSEKL